MLGARPVFVDIDRNTYNIDPLKIKAVITPKTKVIIPVNLYGQCADYDLINEIANRYNLAVIEDAAQSFGATYKGRKSCSLTTVGCTSFFPSKPLGCFGDGGACFTNSAELADRMREIRIHGQSKRYYHTSLGLNGRLDTIQTAILLEKMIIFEEEMNYVPMWQIGTSSYFLSKLKSLILILIIVACTHNTLLKLRSVRHYSVYSKKKRFQLLYIAL
jgi:UDP-2-acetamido-2-deoxy-ribo-hexuluronate aminotransferase